jgi:hypothetical protein
MGKLTKESGPRKAGELVRRLLIGFVLGLVLGMHSHTLLNYSHHGRESANLLSVTSVTNNGLTAPGNYRYGHHYTFHYSAAFCLL